DLDFGFANVHERKVEASRARCTRRSSCKQAREVRTAFFRKVLLDGDEPRRSHGKCVSNRAKYKLCTHGSGEFRARGGIIVRAIQKSTIFLRRSGELAANETAARQKFGERHARRCVERAIDASWTKVALECGDDTLRLCVEFSAGGNFVAVFAQLLLRRTNFFAAIAETKSFSPQRDRRPHPVADAFSVQSAPWKLLGGIPLACGRYVGMREHAIGADFLALHDVLAERDHRIDLPLRKIRIAEVVAGIADLDSDRARIDVALAFP